MRRTVEAPELEAAGNRLLEHVGWHGVVELDFRWQGPGHEPYLIEANARFFGGTFLAMQAGVDYPWLAFRIACGQRPEPLAPAPGDLTVETPVLGLLAVLEDLISTDVAQSTVEAMLAHTQEAVRKGGRLTDLLRQLGSDLEQGREARLARMERVRDLLETHRTSVMEVVDLDDPKPLLGLLYPLSIFVRHGQITPGLLVGAGKS